MERIINYRDIPTDKKNDVLNALEQIGFFPAYGGVKTMQRVMEKSVPGSGPQFYWNSRTGRAFDDMAGHDGFRRSNDRSG